MTDGGGQQLSLLSTAPFRKTGVPFIIVHTPEVSLQSSEALILSIKGLYKASVEDGASSLSQ
jgi:hypothetical protein